MNKITFPLTQGAQSAALADLQEALQVLLDRELILANDEAAGREMCEALKPELADQTYGGATSRLVSLFQEERRLQARGEADQPTAEALNALLLEWGVLDRTRAPSVFNGLTMAHEFRSRGSLSGAEGNTRIEAWQRGTAQDVILASTDVVADGSYLLELGPEVGGRDDVYLRVAQDGVTVASTARRVEWNLRPGTTVMDLEVPADRRVEGQVRDAEHRPAQNVEVSLRPFDSSRADPLIGNAGADQDGPLHHYLRRRGPDRRRTGRSHHPPIPRYGLGRHDTVDVTLGDVPWPGPSVVVRRRRRAGARLGPRSIRE